jgi:hypothetical protein
MTRTRIVSLLALVVAIPAAAAAGSSFFSSAPQPCFMADTGAYRLSARGTANYTIRIDNDAAQPDLRLQLVEDSAQADFVLVDDGDALDACRDASVVKSVRVDAAAATPDMTVTLSKQASEGSHKIYVHSANFTEQDAAALFAAVWKSAHARQSIARR